MQLARLALATISALAFSVLVSETAAMACGQQTDCTIGERSYRIVLPKGFEAQKNLGAIVFTHGHRGSAAQVVTNKSLTRLADELGVAFVAANGVDGRWNLPGVPRSAPPRTADELAYFDALTQDLDKRFGIAAKRIMITGFSAGGMVTWYVACNRGDKYLGFAPLSGTFWEPVPPDCPSGAVNLIHYHGTKDKVVPLDGRRIREAKQGNVFMALGMMARIGHFHPAGETRLSDMDCTMQTNEAGKRLEICLYPSGHGFRAEHIKRAWQIFNGERSG